MRKVFFLALFVVACAKKEQPAADTAAPAPPSPPPPPALTAADIAGTWNGTSKREGETTPVSFTFKSTSDTTGAITFLKTKVSVDFRTKIDGDSVISTSNPYSDPTLPKGTPKVTFRAVGRMKDGKMSGTSAIMLASKPDSVLGHSSWEATKAP